MSENKTHILRQLSEKLEKESITEEERMLLEGFMKKKYEEADWNKKEMGDKEEIKLSILHKINKKKAERRFYPYAIAASIALLLCFSILLLKMQPSQVKLRFATASSADSVLLKDGSIVFLAANSELEYPESFRGDQREVRLLKGDAFFKVARNPERPFIIQSGALETKVLGTSFHIALDKSSCTVTVATGKVKVSARGQSIDLLPNQEVCYKNNSLIKQNRNKGLLSGWFRKDLYLDQVSLSEVFTVLKFRYGVTFEASNQALLKKQVSINLGNTEPLENILNQINYITALKFQAYDKIIKVSQ